MDVKEFLSEAREAVTVRRVYGEPYERNGLTLIPAARVMGGGGGGTGQGPEGQGEGTGGGFGVRGRPVGAYVIEGDRVRWMPAVDLGQVLAMGVVALLLIRSIVKIKARSKLRLAEARAEG